MKTIEERRASQRDYYQKNREQRLKKIKANYLTRRSVILEKHHTPEFREKLRNWMRVYYKNNKEKLWAQEQKRRAKASSEIREKRLKRQRQHLYAYYWKDIEASRLKQRLKLHARRARIANVKNDFTKDQWTMLKKIFQYRCAYCRKKRKLTIDHMIAISKGGEHTAGNIVPACIDCNLSKFINELPHNSTGLQLHLIR